MANGTLQIIEVTQDGAHMLNAINNWLALLFITVGNLFILCFFSCDFILIAFSLLKLVLKCIFRRGSCESSDDKCIVQGAFGGTCTMGMIVGLAIGWGPGVAVSIVKNKVLTTLMVVAVIVLYNCMGTAVSALGTSNYFELVNAGAFA